MQGKEAPEQDAKAKCSVGIDVSKEKLDVYVLPAGERLTVANSREGIRRLKRWLAHFDLALTVVEATGKWHRQLWRSLHASAIPVAMVDPFKVRMFAKATGILAKTDRLDATVLARFAAVMTPAIRPPPPQALEALAELVAARDAAIAEQTSLKNQLSVAKVTMLQRQLGKRIDRIAKDIAALEQEILARIMASQEFARRYQILTSIPSIGPAVAATLIARLAELGALTDKQVAMLAGLAPIADQSGRHDGRRVVFGGRAGVRRMLYLAAVAAIRWNPQMSVFYRRLRQVGKPAKAAILAVARKLVILANKLIADDRTWLPNPPTPA